MDGCQCVPTPPLGLPLHIPLGWVVRALMLSSMLLQLFLVVCGAFRYRSSSFVLRSVVWLAYMAADAVAISALGIMTHSIKIELYGIWAPVLLIHLGGPDSITAYSTADNELWLRHGFIMIYQVLVATYVIYISRLEGYLLAASMLLIIAGATKYAERTLALRSASNTQMVNSTNGIYKFMEKEGSIDPVDYNYVVMGEKKLKELPESAENSRWEFLLNGNEVVTIKHVFGQEGRQKTDKYILCLSHALFKMYKRRFVSLYFHEGVLSKTRRFFISERLLPKDVFRIVEMELKFMYDALFSKSGSTAFSRLGILLRLLNTCLLAVAGYLLFFSLTEKPAQKIVTFVIISVALAVEYIQLCRIALSDWTMVKLICAHIKHSNRPSCGGWYIVKVMDIGMFLLGIARKPFANKYWKDAINQYCMIDARSRSFRCFWKVAGWFGMPTSLVLFYIRVWQINTEDVQKDDLKLFIFEIVKDKCSPEQDIELCRNRVHKFDEYVLTKNCLELQDLSEMQLDEIILVLHIATSICEARDRPKDLPNFKVASMLSRYFAYLLVLHSNILPLHADIAVLAYIDLHKAIIHLPQDASEWKLNTGNEKVDRSINLADKLLQRELNERWDIIAKYWGELLIYVAAYNKAPLHAECMAGGGEFLSQLWALLGHLGCGEQSDSAVTKRREGMQPNEEYIAEKTRKENLRRTRVEEKRRIEEKEERTIQEIDIVRREEDQNRINEEEKQKKLEERLKTIIENPSS